MYIMSVILCLPSTLSHRVGALQMFIIIHMTGIIQNYSFSFGWLKLLITCLYIIGVWKRCLPWKCAHILCCLIKARVHLNPLCFDLTTVVPALPGFLRCCCGSEAVQAGCQDVNTTAATKEGGQAQTHAVHQSDWSDRFSLQTFSNNCLENQLTA